MCIGKNGSRKCGVKILSSSHNAVFLKLLLLHFSKELLRLKKTNLVGIKRQFHKMVNLTQTISRQIADELFECV